MRRLGLVWLGALVTAVAMIATLVALAVVVVLARSSGSSWVVSIAWALALAVGAPVGLARWRNAGRRRDTHGQLAVLALVWNAGAVLVAVQLVPGALGDALRDRGAEAFTRTVGDSHDATRVASALAQYSADALRPAPLHSTIAPTPSAAAESGDIVVPAVDGAGHAVFVVDVALAGAKTSRVAPYLLDTGATLTTMPSDLAAELGIAIPADAPRQSFHTANGMRESALIRVPSMTIGGTTIRDVVVSVCDSCAAPHYRALLGHNVMRHFAVRFDFARDQAVLAPRREADCNRASELLELVELDVEGADTTVLDRVHWIVSVRNRADIAMHEVTPTVHFAGGAVLHGAAIDRVEPGTVGRSLVTGAIGLDGRAEPHSYRLSLARACW
jgi:clan AA aspartic protease (TIGR02281 family)